MVFRQLAFVLSLSQYVTGNNLCVDSDTPFKETIKGKVETCTNTTLDCDMSPTVKSHCKHKCDLSYCCEDTKAPYFKVVQNNGKIHWKSCDRLKKFCTKNPEVASACPVTCKQCVPFSIGDILRLIDGNKANTNLAIGDLEENLLQMINANAANTTAERDKQIDINQKQDLSISFLEEEVKNQARGYRFGNYEYVFVPEKMVWEDHRKAAEEWGGHMASVHSIDEAKFIRSLGKDENVWVFIDGVRSGDTFVNSDGTDFDYTGWAPRQPGSSENRVALQITEPSGYEMHDVMDTYTLAGAYKKEYH